MLRLASCPYANDWMLGRVSTMMSQSLEMLDLSGCTRITAKGVSGLKEMKKLRYLRLEGLDHVKVVARILFFRLLTEYLFLQVFSQVFVGFLNIHGVQNFLL